MVAHVGPATAGCVKCPFGESSGAAGVPVGPSSLWTSSVDDSDSTSDSDVPEHARKPYMRRYQLRRDGFRALEQKNKCDLYVAD
jgi:hypothetical protein